jgi:ATP-dependent Lon protease
LESASERHPEGAPLASGSTEAPHGQLAAPLAAGVVPVLPIRNTVLFPGAVLPLSVGRARSVAAVQYAALNKCPFVILLQRTPETEDPAPANLYEVGTVGQILRYLTSPDGGHHAITRGEQRFRIVEFVEGYPFLAARIDRIAEPDARGAEIEARMHQLKARALEALELMPDGSSGLAEALNTITSPGTLADVVAGFLDIKPAEKQEILETFDIGARLERVLYHLAYNLEVLRLSRDIAKRTEESIAGRQREHILREQLQAIQKELGEGSEQTNDVAYLTEAIAKAKLPEEIEKQANKELKRLARMPDASAEYGMVRTYVEWLAELPWNLEPRQPIEIPAARQILETEHYGLEKIKKRILEYLAVRKLNPTGKSPILCFVGPPGVGKTSLGESIARAMDRPFVRVSVGGVHDEAEIRGHRRTYIGALPGNIIQAIKKAGRRDCVMMLDEIDKLGRGIHGDPASALLEVLDPAQNSTFRDNYLAVPFDLSQVVFIANANQLDTIPGPLLDRMEVIRLSGYTETEKLQIAERYLIARQAEANGVRLDQCVIDEATLRAVIHSYTREAGVRNLEREIGAVFRHAAARIAEEPATRLHITPDSLHDILGPRRYEADIAEVSSQPGVVTGLAWTPVGGDILFIESMRAAGKGRLTLTGQLGDVMKESAQAALSLVKARAPELGIDPKLFDESDIHVHVPAGATPKDGPSAGVAMFIVLASLMTGRAIPPDIAMTGEISLRGRVLPVGGIKEKVLAAMNAGIKTVLLPAGNRKDYEDIPPEAQKALKFVWLETEADALKAAFSPAKPA